MTLESLAKHKTALKKSTPKFIKQDARNIKRLAKNWRKPRGFQSKMRRNKKGKPKMVSIGYKTPRALQGVLTSGLRERAVSNLTDLKTINPKTELAVLSSGVGKRKTLELVQEAKKIGVSFSNISTDNKVKEIQDFLEARKKVKKEKAAAAKKKKEKEKKKEKKKAEKKAKEVKKEEKPEEVPVEAPKEEKLVEEKKQVKKVVAKKPAKKVVKKATKKSESKPKKKGETKK